MYPHGVLPGHQEVPGYGVSGCSPMPYYLTFLGLSLVLPGLAPVRASPAHANVTFHTAIPE